MLDDGTFEGKDWIQGYRRGKAGRAYIVFFPCFIDCRDVLSHTIISRYRPGHLFHDLHHCLTSTDEN